MEQFLLYDVPLFLLFFGLILILTKFVVRIQDPIMNTAIAAFSASLAFFIVRSQDWLYRWFFQNWTGLFGLVVLLFIFMLVWFMLRI